jgi:hypothetical protein
LTETLGTEWTIVINPLAIWPYAEDSWAKDSLGSCLASYLDGAISRFKDFASKYGDDGKQELNSIAYKHQLNMEYDDKKTYSYCGPAIQDGQVVILFSAKQLGTNSYYALSESEFQKALNSAPPPPSANGHTSPMSYAARTSIKQDWDPKIEELQKQIGTLLEMPDIKLEPNFESNFAVFKAKASEKKSGIRDDWESYLGSFTYQYFEGLMSTLQWKEFGDDDMLREGFQEGVSKGEVQFKVVEKLEKGNYNECLLKDGVLYMQTEPKNFGTNISDCASNIIELL